VKFFKWLFARCEQKLRLRELGKAEDQLVKHLATDIRGCLAPGEESLGAIFSCMDLIKAYVIKLPGLSGLTERTLHELIEFNVLTFKGFFGWLQCVLRMISYSRKSFARK